MYFLLLTIKLLKAAEAAPIYGNFQEDELELQYEEAPRKQVPVKGTPLITTLPRPYMGPPQRRSTTTEINRPGISEQMYGTNEERKTGNMSITLGLNDSDIYQNTDRGTMQSRNYGKFPTGDKKQQIGGGHGQNAKMHAAPSSWQGTKMHSRETPQNTQYEPEFDTDEEEAPALPPRRSTRRDDDSWETASDIFFLPQDTSSKQAYSTVSLSPKKLQPTAKSFKPAPLCQDSFDSDSLSEAADSFVPDAYFTPPSGPKELPSTRNFNKPIVPRKPKLDADDFNEENKSSSGICNETASEYDEGEDTCSQYDNVNFDNDSIHSEEYTSNQGRKYNKDSYQRGRGGNQTYSDYGNRQLESYNPQRDYYQGKRGNHSYQQRVNPNQQQQGYSRGGAVVPYGREMAHTQQPYGLSSFDQEMMQLSQSFGSVEPFGMSTGMRMQQPMSFGGPQVIRKADGSTITREKKGGVDSEQEVIEGADGSVTRITRNRQHMAMSETMRSGNMFSRNATGFFNH